MVDTIETKWFKIIIFIFSGACVGIFIAAIVYYNRIRNGSGTGGMTKGEANAMWIIFIILLVIALIIFIWSMVRLFISSSVREDYAKQALAFANQTGDVFDYRPFQTTDQIQQASRAAYQASPPSIELSNIPARVVPNAGPLKVTSPVVMPAGYPASYDPRLSASVMPVAGSRLIRS